MGRFIWGVRIGAAVVLIGGVSPAAATTTTTRPRPPRAFAPSVSPSTIYNRSGCGPTTATVSTGTTGDVDRVQFRVNVRGRTSFLYASGSGSRWQATLNAGSYSPDAGPGYVRAIATGPGGTTESADTNITVKDCAA